MTYSPSVHDVAQGSLLDTVLMWDNIRGPGIVTTVSGTPGDPFIILPKYCPKMLFIILQSAINKSADFTIFPLVSRIIPLIKEKAAINE